MMKRLFGIVAAVLAVAFLTGCGKPSLYSPESFKALPLNPSPSTKKVDTFLVVLDTSPWLHDRYERRIESERAREIVSRLNQAIPDLGYRAGLVASAAGACFGCEGTRLLYGPAPYRRAEFEAVLSGIGGGPLPASGQAGFGTEFRHADWVESAGRVALIVVSDGENIFHGAAVKNAQKLKAALGDRLCIYPIYVGWEDDGFEVMNLLARVGGCGFAVHAEEIASPASMADYVSAVFLGPAALPALAASPAGGPGPDSDGDGVGDGRDRCPNSPRGIRVGEDGCWNPPAVYFDSGQAAIRDAGPLAEVVTAFKANPALTGEIQGHADNTASPAYNQRLSVSRAEAVRAHLAGRGIAPERIRVKGFGETQPAASNDSAEGRAMNRRAVFRPDMP